MRNMSPQAYRRLRRALTEGELRDLAQDITEHLVSRGLMSITDGATEAAYFLMVHADEYGRETLDDDPFRQHYWKSVEQH